MAALEHALDVATQPKSSDIAVQTFCDCIQAEENGPKDAVAMLLDKMRSHNIDVAVRSLEVLDIVVHRCGRPVHAVIGKFRFLNELIKMVSPKYHENRPQRVVVKILELVQIWGDELPHEPKIKEVFKMLKQQGNVFPKPSREPSTEYLEAPRETAAQRHSPLEQDEKKAKLLERLLKSKDPNDLMKANKLIKKMVEQDAKKQERLAKFRHDLETAKENVRLLSDILSNFDIANQRVSDDDIVQELLVNCNDTRKKLVKLASDVDETLLGDVLSTSDDITRVLDLYNSLLGKQPAQSTPQQQQQQQQQQQPQSNHVDLFGDDTHNTNGNHASTASNNDGGLADLFGPTTPTTTTTTTATTATNNATSTPMSPQSDMDLFMSQPTTSTNNNTSSSQMTDLFGMQNAPQQPQQQPQQPQQSLDLFASMMDTPTSPQPPQSQQNDLDLFSLNSNSQPTQPTQPTQQQQNNTSAIDTSSLLSLESLTLATSQPKPTPPQQQPQQQPQQPPQPQQQSPPPSLDASLLLLDDSTTTTTTATQEEQTPPPLSSISISLESIKPSPVPPVSAYDLHDLKINIHAASNSPHPTMQVFVVSFLNQNTIPLTNLSFQAAVPKALQVKLMPPSSDSIDAFNPITGPKAVTQVMIISNPSKAPLKLRFKLHFVKGSETVDDMKDVGSFPSM